MESETDSDEALTVDDMTLTIEIDATAAIHAGATLYAEAVVDEREGRESGVESNREVAEAIQAELNGLLGGDAPVLKIPGEELGEAKANTREQSQILAKQVNGMTGDRF